MATTVDSKDKIDESQVSYLEGAAEDIRDKAIAEALKKLDVSQRDLSLEYLLNHHSTFIDYFKYGLASEAARVLASNDQSVKAIYLHDPDVNPGNYVDIDTLPDVTVHLLVEVSTLATVENLVASLDRAITTNLKELPSLLFDKREFILDTQLISEEDVRFARGYGSLISSMFAPALKLWERTA